MLRQNSPITDQLDSENTKKAVDKSQLLCVAERQDPIFTYLRTQHCQKQLSFRAASYCDRGSQRNVPKSAINVQSYVFLIQPFFMVKLVANVPYSLSVHEQQVPVTCLTHKKSHGLGWGVYSQEFLAGVCLLVFQILTLFQTETSRFSHSFSDLASENCTRFANLREKPIYRYCLSVLSSI